MRYFILICYGSKKINIYINRITRHLIIFIFRSSMSEVEKRDQKAAQMEGKLYTFI